MYGNPVAPELEVVGADVASAADVYEAQVGLHMALKVREAHAQRLGCLAAGEQQARHLATACPGSFLAGYNSKGR